MKARARAAAFQLVHGRILQTLKPDGPANRAPRGGLCPEARYFIGWRLNMLQATLATLKLSELL
jgi:hypothetical protein